MHSGRSRATVTRLAALFFACCLPAAHLGHGSEKLESPSPARASNQNREELIQRARAAGEIRVIVGLHTSGESAQALDRTSDEAKAAAIAAQQSHLLERLASYRVDHFTRLRLHPFITITVDAAALAALFSDPDVASVSEERALRPNEHHH